MNPKNDGLADVIAKLATLCSEIATVKSSIFLLETSLKHQYSQSFTKVGNRSEVVNATSTANSEDDQTNLEESVVSIDEFMDETDQSPNQQHLNSFVLTSQHSSLMPPQTRM